MKRYLRIVIVFVFVMYAVNGLLGVIDPPPPAAHQVVGSILLLLLTLFVASSMINHWIDSLSRRRW